MFDDRVTISRKVGARFTAFSGMLRGEEFDDRDSLVYRPIVAGISWKKTTLIEFSFRNSIAPKRRAPHPFAGPCSSACVSKYQEWVAEALLGTMERVSENSGFFLARRVPCDVP